MTSALATGTAASVIPGPAQMIQPAYAASILIVNNDTTNAVWLSASSTCAPGQGVKLGALGSIQWTENTPCWACVDSGVTSPVSLFLSSAAANPVNPVDVATAVATELLETGVPNAVKFTPVYSGQPAPGTSFNIDVHEYETLNITMIAGAGSPLPLGVLLTWADGAGHGLQEFAYDDNQNLTNLQVAVIAPILQITVASNVVWGIGSGYGLFITGSNRTAITALLSSEQFYAGPDLWSYPDTAFVVGQAVTLQQAMPGTRINGSVWAGILVPLSTTLKGNFSISTYQYHQPISIEMSNTSEMVIVGSGQKVFKQFALPVNGYQITFYCTTAGTSALQVAFIKANS